MKTFFKEKTSRDKAYLKWIDTLPCIVKGCVTNATHHHVETGGKGFKCSDYRTIPLCYPHHFQLHRIGRHSFAALYGINYEKELIRLNALWEKNHGPISKERTDT
jgi:hypothetical protein